MLEIGSWSTVGNKALTMALYIPDFDAHAVAPCRLLCICRNQYQSALKGCTTGQYREDLTNLFVQFRRKTAINKHANKTAPDEYFKCSAGYKHSCICVHCESLHHMRLIDFESMEIPSHVHVVDLAYYYVQSFHMHM